MTTPINMPQLGESVAEGTLGRWLKQPGDWVAKDEPLAEIITDKVNAELPSPVEGRVEALLVEEGATVGVGTAIAQIAEEAARPAGDVVSVGTPPVSPSPPDRPPADVGMFAGALDSLDAPIGRAEVPREAATDGGEAADDGGERRRVRSSPL